MLLAQFCRLESALQAFELVENVAYIEPDDSGQIHELDQVNSAVATLDVCNEWLVSSHRLGNRSLRQTRRQPLLNDQFREPSMSSRVKCLRHSGWGSWSLPARRYSHLLIIQKLDIVKR